MMMADSSQGSSAARVKAWAYVEHGVQHVTARCSACMCTTTVRLGKPQSEAVKRAAILSCFRELRAQGCTHVSSGPAN